MSSIADQYPARTDSNGTTWYRPTPETGLQWGWTSQEKYADPSYFEEVVDTQE